MAPGSLTPPTGFLYSVTPPTRKDAPMSRAAAAPLPSPAASTATIEDGREFGRFIFAIQTQRQYYQMAEAAEKGLALRLLDHFIGDDENPSGKMLFLLQCVVESQNPACFNRLTEWAQSAPDRATEFRDAIGRAMVSKQMQPKLQALLDHPECQTIIGRPPPLYRRAS